MALAASPVAVVHALPVRKHETLVSIGRGVEVRHTANALVRCAVGAGKAWCFMGPKGGYYISSLVHLETQPGGFLSENGRWLFFMSNPHHMFRV